MTVKEFIEILKKENQNAEVIKYSEEGVYFKVDCIQESSDKEIVI